MEILVLTISDRASAGVYEDRSGPAVEAVVREAFPEASVTRRIVPDDADRIRDAFEAAASCAAILTTGGTGLSPRDVTPEVTTQYCDRLVPGIAEALRAESLKQTPNAMLSRGAAGMKGTTLIVNLPGSERAASFCARVLAPVLAHAVAMARGDGH